MEKKKENSLPGPQQDGESPAPNLNAKPLVSKPKCPQLWSTLSEVPITTSMTSETPVTTVAIKFRKISLQTDRGATVRLSLELPLDPYS